MIKQRYQVANIELYNNKGQQIIFDTEDINALHIELEIVETTETDGSQVRLKIFNLLELHQFYSSGMK